MREPTTIEKIKGYFSPYRTFFLKRLFGIWTKKELEKIMKQEIKNNIEAEYYAITKQEELRKDIIRNIEFTFWKIFTR